MKPTIRDAIAHLRGRPDACDWLEKQRTLAQAWRDCPRADWMVRLVAALFPRRMAVRCMCDCAEVALARTSLDNLISTEVIGIVRRWCAGRATPCEVERARAAAANVEAAAAHITIVVSNGPDAAAADAAIAVEVIIIYASDAAHREMRDLIRRRVSSRDIARKLEALE